MSFTRKYERKPKPALVIPEVPPEPRAVMGVSTLRSAPKTAPFRSKPLREAYRLIGCQWEGCQASEAECAHSNFHEFGGKGGARKADDNFAASLCRPHHRGLDQGGSLSYEERRDGWHAAHLRTIDALIALSQESGARAAKLRNLLRLAGWVK